MMSGYAAGGPPRTPSPTPSDIEELKKGAIDFKALMNWRTWLQRKYLWYYVAGVLFAVVVALISIFHKQIVDALTPASQYLRTLPGGWSIPIGVMFVLSFPPLFGNEIVHVLCGIVWGIWIGFGIVCAGTFLGEVGNFYAFRYCCKSRGEKLEKNSLSYACLAKVVREGGFLIALIIRLSAIPGHFTTAVFSTCGMGIISFSLGAILSLPKQFATVYIGVILHQSAGVQTTQQRLISAGVLVLTTAVTIFAAWWVWKKMNAAKPAVLAERRKAKALALYNQKMYAMRNADLESASNVNLVAGPSAKNTPYDTASSASTVTVGKFNNNHSNAHLWPGKGNGSVDFGKPFNTSESAVNLPLSVKPQRWDADGRAVLDNQTDFGDGSHHHSSVEDQDWSRRPPPAGAKMPAVVQGGTQTQQLGRPTSPPDIRVIRASGTSTNTNTSAPGRLPYDYPPVSAGVPSATSPSSSRSPPTSPTRRGQSQSPPQGMYAPRGPSEDSGESGPQWAAGVGKEDDAEAAVPLTAGLQSSQSMPANMHSSASPSYPAQQQRQQQPPQPPQIMTSSTSQPAMMRSAAPASPYDNMAFYNPYDRPQQQQQQQPQQQQQAVGRHRWEETDASAASYHTAEGTMGSPQYAGATQRQLPLPASESRQQQTPSPPGGFGGAYYSPQQQYGNGGGLPYTR
ncbi:Tlg2-vesicle protein [Tulasnella sp. 424]|nr:Tlg2-vesicle protein [Tulasnella sp. 424]KAG8974138.1 Tlg2-vesicle protein [Tulasnella sp. 425]